VSFLPSPLSSHYSETRDIDGVKPTAGEMVDLWTSRLRHSGRRAMRCYISENTQSPLGNLQESTPRCRKVCRAQLNPPWFALRSYTRANDFSSPFCTPAHANHLGLNRRMTRTQSRSTLSIPIFHLSRDSSLCPQLRQQDCHTNYNRSINSSTTGNNRNGMAHLPT
jgi:hypothetical protein